MKGALKSKPRCQLEIKLKSLHEQDILRQIQAPTPLTRWKMNLTDLERLNGQSAYPSTAIDYENSYEMVSFTKPQTLTSRMELI